MQQSERKLSRTRSPRGKSPSCRMSRWLCKDYLRGICNNSFFEKWCPPECLFYKTKSGCRFGGKCSHAHRQVDEQPTERSKKSDGKSAVALLKKGYWQERLPVTDGCHDRLGKPGKRMGKKLGQNSSKRQFSDARQLGCVLQDMTPPKSILRKSTHMPKPIQRVINSDISPVQVSELVDDRSGKLEEIQANENQKLVKKRPRLNGRTCVILRFRNGCKNSGKIWWMMKFHYRGGSHASSSHEVSLEPTSKRREDLGKHNVHTHFLKTEIARSVRGPKLQGPHAEDVMAKPYLEL